MTRHRVARREFIAGIAALGAGVLLPRAESSAQTVATPHRIDVHHHLFPPTYIAAALAMKVEGPRADWTPARSLEEMDRAGVAVSIMSIAAAGVSFLDDAGTRRLARECNDYAARLAADHPGRFGIFASLPMPHVENTLREIEYAFGTLKADGVVFVTSYGDKWLGDPAFAAVMDELNRRKAVVYTHPTTPKCCKNLVPDVGESIIEYGTDTTRTIASLVFSGTAMRCPDMKVIFSHAGGSMPFLTERFVRLPLIDKKLAPRGPNGVAYELKRFYYDTAQASNPMALSSLLKLVAVSQVLFGSDFPYRTDTDHVKGLADYGFNTADLMAVERENAIRLIPRLKA